MKFNNPLKSFRLAFDIGGTFTDIVLLDEKSGSTRTIKVPTNADTPQKSFFDGSKRLIDSQITYSQLESIIHATTVATNTIIEGKGSKTGLITTVGFRDVLEIGRAKRSNTYDMFEERPPPLVPRHLRLEVNERMDARGKEIHPVEPVEIRSKLEQLLTEGIETIAVCFLHSFQNPAHELEVRKIASEYYPNIFVSLSSEVFSEWREYERVSTTVANAYVQPSVAKYLNDIQETLRKKGFTKDLLIMQSNGGFVDSKDASRLPIRILESGPAAGVVAAKEIGAVVGKVNLIPFDMGGTTAKCSVIRAGEPSMTTEFEVSSAKYGKGSGYPIKIPTIDLVEIGAGGGSIARISMGLLKVGPDSAGAKPGPACYDQGGTEPTVTDADVVLGYLNPHYLLGGAMPISQSKSREAISNKIAKPLNLSIEDASKGIHDVVNSNMSNAIRSVTVRRGIDPTQLTLVSYGGAGPVHASGLARALEVKEVIVPPAPGLMSAMGLLLSDARVDFSWTDVALIDELDFNSSEIAVRSLEEKAAELLHHAGVGKIRFERIVEMRYRGQGFEIPVQINLPMLTPHILKQLFEKYYKAIYGYLTDDPIQVITWRVTGIGRSEKPIFKELKNKSSIKDAIRGNRKVRFDSSRFVDTVVYDRNLLPPRAKIAGPAIIEENDSTTVVYPQDTFSVDKHGIISIKVNQAIKRRS